MTNAIITTTTSAPGSQAVFLNSLTTAMETAGFTLLDSYTASGNEARVYSFVADAAKTFGTLIIEAAFSAATTMNIRGYRTWDTATNTGTGVSTNTVKTVNPATVYGFHVCNHPEVRGVSIVAAGVPLGFVGYFRPLTPNVDENLFNFAFIDNGGSMFWQSSNQVGLKPISSVHPYPNVSLQMIEVRVTNVDARRGNARLIIPAAISTSGTNSIAEFSSDCVLGASGGMNPLDVFQVTPGAEEYQLFDGAAAPTTYARFAVRVV